MNDVITEPDVIVDESCCLNWRMPDGTQHACDQRGIWEIQRNGEVMAFTCDQHLQRVLGLAYTYEPDETVSLHVVPMLDLQVQATVPYLGSAISASLRPVPVGCGIVLERGRVTRAEG